uniref:Putative secreted protein n=1 Tax=Anopheles marajoara TaxID=58244 RepID=A0A2M4C8Y5_9DIPT
MVPLCAMCVRGLVQFCFAKQSARTVLRCNYLASLHGSFALNAASPSVMVRVQSTSSLAYLLYQHADATSTASTICAMVLNGGRCKGCCNANKIVLPTAAE